MGLQKTVKPGTELAGLVAEGLLTGKLKQLNQLVNPYYCWPCRRDYRSHVVGDLQNWRWDCNDNVIALCKCGRIAEPYNPARFAERLKEELK